jgi:MoxR-like ATPase/integrase
MPCRRLCTNWIAKKPASGERYAEGQVRCDTCEIFMYPSEEHTHNTRTGNSDSNPKNGLSCNCCNSRISTRSKSARYSRYQDPNNSEPLEKDKETSSEEKFEESPFWIASGSWNNWNHTMNNLPIRWGTKAENLWKILKINDIVFCSASSKSDRIFSDNGIFMVGRVKRKFKLEKNDDYYPDASKDPENFFKYRFEIEPLKIVKTDEGLLPLVPSLTVRQSINHITNPQIIKELLDNLESLWDIKLNESISSVFLSEEDFRKMVDAIPLVTEYNKSQLTNSDHRIPNPKDIQLCAKLQYYCTLRLAELLKITPKDIYLENYEIKIAHRNDPNSFDITTIHPEIKNELEEYLKDKPQNEMLFPFTRQLLWSYYKKAGELAELNLFKEQNERKIEGMSTSILRESRGRHMLKKGAGEGLTRLKLRISNDDPLFKFDEHTLQKLKDWEREEYKNMSDEFGINYWKISPGEKAEDWQNQKSLGVIAISWNEVGDLSTQTFEQIHQKILEKWYSRIAVISPQFRHFTSIKKGDIILANNGKMKIIGIGKVIGDYKFRPELKYAHTILVKWYDITEKDIPIQEGWMQTVASLSKEKFEELTGSYYIITQNEGIRYDNISGVQYAYDSDKAHYKNFLEGTNFVVQSKIEGENYFVGHGKVKNIERLQGKNPHGNDITKIIAKFSNYEEFPERKIRTDEINNKMLDIAFPKKGARNIPPAMLQITKELYDEIITGKKRLKLPPEKLFEDDQIDPVTSVELERGLKEIKKELLIPDKKIVEIINALASGSHIILAGPIGTGKTELARIIPKLFWSTEGGYYSDIHTATADWNTQDVIGGIVPKMDGKDVVYKIQDGCVTESVRKNWVGDKRSSTTIDGHVYRGVWIIIDEFNRADIDKAFGQLFTALRTREMKIPTDSMKKTSDLLKIPKDFRIIGTLNTADKHYLFPLSDALKSRFAFIEIDIPDIRFKDNEIFYALKNALNSLEIKLTIDFKLDHINKTVESSGNQTYSKIYEAYNFLDFVREFHKLGTGILKIIYQNILAGVNSKFDINEVLDNSINSVIIPQLEKLSEIELGSIQAIINGNLVEFLQEINKTNKRYNSSKIFSKIISYLNLNPKDYEYFSERELKNNDKLWVDINNALDSRNSDKEKLPINLHQTTKSLDALIEQSII